MSILPSLGRVAVAALCVVGVLAGASISAGLGNTTFESSGSDVIATPPATVADRATPVLVLGAVEERDNITPDVVPTTRIAERSPIPPTSLSTTVAPSSSLPSPATTELAVAENPHSTVPSRPSVAELGEQADHILGYPWQERFPTWTVVWADGREGVRALTFPDRMVVEMYVRDGDDAHYLARVLAHELGHVADIELNSDDDRARWRDARGLADTVPWWPTEGAYDFDTAAGDFAEGFATLLVGSKTKSNVAGPLTALQLDVMASLSAE
ncbi:MAG: hypothetical protein V3V01_17475 [Acidimicrobiales bacterium]